MRSQLLFSLFDFFFFLLPFLFSILLTVQIHLEPIELIIPASSSRHFFFLFQNITIVHLWGDCIIFFSRPICSHS